MATKQAKVEVSTIIHDDGGFTHTLNYTNGHTRVFSVAPDHELYARFAAAGAKGKILGAANSADDSDKAVTKVDALLDAFDEGEWSLVGEGGPKYSPLVRALAELKGISEGEANTIVKGLTKSQQAKLRRTERIATLIAKFKGETDGDAVLDDLLKDEGDDAIERVA